MGATMQPFRVYVPEATLADINDRIARTRWPKHLGGDAWELGTDPGYLRELAEYWLSSFDWRSQERYINAFSQFRANVDGVDIHFIHDRGQGRDPLPLLLTNGWPSNFYEMHKVITRSSSLPVAWEARDGIPGGVGSRPLGRGERIDVPASVAVFGESWPREWAERSYSRLLRWTEMPRGGHFAAMEEPRLLVDDMRTFFRSFRTARSE
jgi:hypothetical protein